MKRLQFCLAVFAVLALTFSAFAQVQNGQFTGTVTDPTGAAIANAKVTVSNPATDLNLTATTNSGRTQNVNRVAPVYRICLSSSDDMPVESMNTGRFRQTGANVVQYAPSKITTCMGGMITGRGRQVSGFVTI